MILTFMNSHFEQLWQHYQSTEFLLTQQLSLSSSFAIVTAHNPEGQILTSCQNRLRDRALLRDIESYGVPYRALVGASNDLAHMEKSWAVFLSKADSLALARRYQQNAIYYVIQDQLELLPCVAEATAVSLGSFSKRVRLVTELPDLGR
ncbi:DUF3293 domain-containing protein [Shewanella sp.]|uniref:DUF3293 domain-containing protein n=1 Tax=Shewanella sp. TaxID=50422 RepID=UPI003568042E